MVHWFEFQQISVANPFRVTADVQLVDFESFILTIKEGAVFGNNTLKLHFNRMQEFYDTMPDTEKAWLTEKFFPGAMDRLAEWVTTCEPPRLPGDTTFEPFWVMSLSCYLEHFEGRHAQLVMALRWYGELERSKHR